MTDPLDRLPHRAPIRCLDRFLCAGPDRAEAEFLVRHGPHTVDDRAWEGTLIEGMAQTAIGISPPRESNGDQVPAPAEGMLVQITGLTIHRKPRVGERVRFVVELDRRIGDLLRVQAFAQVGNQRIADGCLTLHEGSSGRSEIAE